MRILSFVSKLRRSPSRIIAIAARSFTLPPGLYHSALATTRTGDCGFTTRLNESIGVLPMRSSTDWPIGAEVAGAAIFTVWRGILRFAVADSNRLIGGGGDDHLQHAIQPGARLRVAAIERKRLKVVCECWSEALRGFVILCGTRV